MTKYYFFTMPDDVTWLVSNEDHSYQFTAEHKLTPAPDPPEIPLGLAPIAPIASIAPNERYLALDDKSYAAYNLETGDAIQLEPRGLCFGDLPLNLDVPRSISREDLLQDLLASDIGTELPRQLYVVELESPRFPLQFAVYSWSLAGAVSAVRSRLGWAHDGPEDLTVRAASIRPAGPYVIPLYDEE